MEMNAVIVLVFLCAAVASAAIALLLADTFGASKRRIARRIAEELQTGGVASRGSLFKDLTADSLGDETAGERVVARIRNLIDQSGVGATLSGLALLSLFLGIAGGGIAWSLTGFWPTVFAAASCAAAAPPAYVLLRRRRRIDKLRAQLPEAFDLMGCAVRAGQTLSEALRIAAIETKAPLGSEFAHCCQQQNLGLSFDVSFRELGRRTGVVELQIFIVAMLVQRQTGSNPTEILDNIADVVRKRICFMGKVRALTGEGRMQAIVLSLLPAAALAALFAINRQYAQILLDRPQWLLGCAVSQSLGILWIRRLVRLEF